MSQSGTPVLIIVYLTPTVTISFVTTIFANVPFWRVELVLLYCTSSVFLYIVCIFLFPNDDIVCVYFIYMSIWFFLCWHLCTCISFICQSVFSMLTFVYVYFIYMSICLFYVDIFVPVFHLYVNLFFLCWHFCACISFIRQSVFSMLTYLCVYFIYMSICFFYVDIFVRVFHLYVNLFFSMLTFVYEYFIYMSICFSMLTFLCVFCTFVFYLDVFCGLFLCIYAHHFGEYIYTCIYVKTCVWTSELLRVYYYRCVKIINARV